MTWMPPTDTFTVERPKTDVFAPSGDWQEKIEPKAPWQKASTEPAPAWQSDEDLKKQFGIELAKSTNSLDAAYKVFADEPNKAVWVSWNWLNDPIVVASKDIYLKTVELSSPPLDREQIAAKALAIADEKILKNGQWIPTVEAKDRLAAIRLYTDILGYTGKVEIDNSKKYINNNTMTIKLVKAEEKKPVTINNAPIVKSEIATEIPSPITLKLVGGASR
jgi:hypothetical protein